MSANKKIVKLPKHVTLGAFKVEIVLIPHEVAYEISDAQGVFLGKPPYKIFLDEEIISDGGMDAVNVLIHEFFHLGFYQYLLKDKEEELEKSINVLFGSEWISIKRHHSKVLSIIFKGFL